MLIYEALFCFFSIKSRQLLIIQMWRKFLLPSCELWPEYTHLLLDNNTVFMSNDSVGWAWRRPEGGPAGTDSNTLLLSHTSALMHIVTPHIHLQHTHCLSPPHLSLLHTHTHTICVALLKSVSECAWGSHPSHVPKKEWLNLESIRPPVIWLFRSRLVKVINGITKNIHFPPEG